MRSLSVFQVAVLVACLGSLGVIAVPAFLQNLHASRLAEPIDGLGHIGQMATFLAAGAPAALAYPPSAPRSPDQVPAGERVTDAARVWQHPTWRRLEFSIEGPHYYSFEFASQVAGPTATFFATAYGDLDGDGQLSRLRLAGERKDGEHPRLYPVSIEREVE